MHEANHRPRRRGQLCTTTVRGRFVVLDPAARTLIELHPDVADLWPLLEGRLTPAELAAQWEVTADIPNEEGQRVIGAVLDELTSTALLDAAD